MSPLPASKSLSPILFHGAAWYPEQWNHAAIERDIEGMSRLEINVVRVAEFAWARFEPREGELETAWLGKTLDLLHSHNIRVILGTPSATPPQWLLTKYPEIGYVDIDGYRHKHGTRQHACYNNEIFRGNANRIAGVMARVFAGHPSVVGWQIDNEIRGHQKICICPSCHALWSKWLEKRYGTIENLNDAWGNQVWSLAYASFQDVVQPYRVCCWSHAYSPLINYRRFMSDSAIDFMREQVEVLRSAKAGPITHNSEDSVNELDLVKDLDFGSADIYVDYGTPMDARLRLDSMRNIKPGRRFWTMETGTDAMVLSRMAAAGWLACFAFLNYVSGSTAILYWLWRQNRSGAEITHQSVLYSNGQPTQAWGEIEKVSKMRRILEPIVKEFSPAKAEVALIRSEMNGHYFFTDRIGGLEPNFSYREKLGREYETLVEIGAWRDILFDDAPLDGYKVIFSPYLPYASPTFLRSMEAHLKAGGTWVIGPYCGYLDQDHTTPTNALLGQVEKMIGFKTKYFCSIGEVNVCLLKEFKSRAFMYGTVFDPSPEDEILGVYEGGRFGGEAWGISRRYAKGRVYVLGSDVEPSARASLYNFILDRAELERSPQPARVWLCPQSSADGRIAWAISNWDDKAHAIVLPKSGRNLIDNKAVAGTLHLAPYTSAFIAFD